MRTKLDKPSLSMVEKESLEDELESKEWDIKVCKKNIISSQEEVNRYEKKLDMGNTRETAEEGEGEGWEGQRETSLCESCSWAV